MEAKNLSKLFIDTGAFIALICQDDNLHNTATIFYQSLRKSTLLITSILVISETYTWLRYHKGSRPAAIFLKILNDGIESGDYGQ